MYWSNCFNGSLSQFERQVPPLRLMEADLNQLNIKSDFISKDSIFFIDSIDVHVLGFNHMFYSTEDNYPMALSLLQLMIYHTQ